MTKILQTLRRTGKSDGWVNWRTNSAERRIERKQYGVCGYRRRMARSFARSGFRRLERTTQIPKESLGWAEVRHPFHPLKGQRFPVLKTRRVGGAETLILREPVRGSLAVRRDWTDWDETTASAGIEPSPRKFSFDSLLELVDLVNDLRHPAPTEVDQRRRAAQSV
jgi:hypothetical protein